MISKKETPAKRVLLIDDNRTNLASLKMLMESDGWLVDSAPNGAEALVLARRTPPELVISDLLMPVMDGFHLLRHWKADTTLSAAPFIVYSATYVEADDKRLAAGMGADDFILKPSDPVAFLARVDQVMEKHRKPATVDAQLYEVSEEDLLSLYSERLVRKLEKKSLELKAANLALQEDIRRREEVELELRKTETLLRIAGKAAKLGGWTIELPDRSRVWSDEVCAILEVPPGTLPTTVQAIEYIAPEFRGVVGDKVDLCVREGRSFDLDVQIITAKRRRVWVRIIGQAERDESGAVSRMVGAIQDIDEQRALEEQFRQAQKMEAVGHLAGGIAHDFNNILSVILGYSDMLLDGLTEDGTLREDLEEIHQAGLRATDITKKLLFFSRHQMLEPRVLDMGKVVVGVENLLKRLLGAHIELSLITGFSQGKILADPGQLEQIIMNLAINSRDAMASGGKLSVETVDVTLDAAYCAEHRDLEPGPYVMLAVTDTGCGIASDLIGRVFEPFYTTKEKGTGLGLSSVSGIVKQGRGHVAVFSEPDRGTTFQIYFPRTDYPQEPSTELLPASAQRRGTETVLVVEDEEFVRRVISAILRRKGYFVLEAEHGDEALRVCEQLTKPLHLLVTDLVMPRMGGRNLVEALRPTRPDLKILYISGYTKAAIIERGLLAPPATFLAKPITPHSLLARVREVLDQA